MQQLPTHCMGSTAWQTYIGAMWSQWAKLREVQKVEVAQLAVTMLSSDGGSNR